MNPLAFAIDLARNALRAVRNLLALLLPAPDFVALMTRIADVVGGLR